MFCNMFSIFLLFKELNLQVEKCRLNSWVKASAFKTYNSLIFKNWLKKKTEKKGKEKTNTKRDKIFSIRSKYFSAFDWLKAHV